VRERALVALVRFARHLRRAGGECVSPVSTTRRMSAMPYLDRLERLLQRAVDLHDLVAVILLTHRIADEIARTR